MFITHRNTLLVGLLLATQFAHAATPLAALPTPPRRTVARAIDAVTSVPDTVLVKSSLSLTPSKAAKDRRLTAFQVRIFTLVDETGAHLSRPRPINSIDDEKCDVYLSSVIPLTVNMFGKIEFGTLDEAWLGVTSSRDEKRDGRFLFVFEVSDARDQVFRLRAADADKYFNQGFILTVKDSSSADLSLVQAKAQRAKENAATLYRTGVQTTGGVPCYRYEAHTMLADQPGAHELAAGELLACHNSQNPTGSPAG